MKGGGGPPPLVKKRAGKYTEMEIYFQV